MLNPAGGAKRMPHFKVGSVRSAAAEAYGLTVQPRLYPLIAVPAANATKAAAEPIPGYKLVKRIGAGGYGEVWAAEAPGQLVKAIKFVYGLLDEDRAAREMKALNRIRGVRHPFL